MKSKGASKKAKLDLGSKSDHKHVGKAEPVSPKPTPSPTELLAISKMKAAVAAAAASTSSNLSLAAAQSSLAGALELPSYPLFALLDLQKEFPRMAHVLNLAKTVTSSSEQAIPLEEVDAIQAELETLWSSVSIRARTLERERELLQHAPSSVSDASSSGLLEHYDLNHQEKINAVKSIIDSGHGTRTSVSAAAKLVLGVTTPSALTNNSLLLAAANSAPVLVGSTRKSNNSMAAKLEKQPKKKLKGEPGSAKGRAGSNSSGVGGLPANRFTQNRSHSLSLDECHTEAPNQFWEFSGVYCRDITTEDLDTLEKMMEGTKDSLPASIFDSPPLGKHYLEQEEFAGTRKQKTRLEIKNRDNDVCGPLTQKVVSALVDASVAKHNQESGNVNGSNDFNGTFISRPGLIKALGLEAIGNPNINGGTSLEARLKQVLCDQGILFGDECSEDPDLPDDEIMSEIKRTQSSLRKLHEHNKEALEKLYNKAKEANAKIPIKAELAKIDKEVLDSYKLVHSSRLKKKPITKKERDTAMKALHGRMAVLEKLGSVDLTGLKK